MRLRALQLSAAACVLFIGLLVAGPASAQAPSNDTIAGATVIPSLPFSDEVDTTEANTDAADLAAAQPCIAIGAPAIEKAVWYTGTAASDLTVLVDVTGSSYSAGIAIYSGTPGDSTFLGCGPGQFAAFVTTGQTYYVMVFGDTPGSAGGTLSISVSELPPPPTLAATMDDQATKTKDGGAVVSGTVTCEGDAAFVQVSGNLTQRAGRVTITGFFAASLDPSMCNGTPIPWTAPVTGANGRYAGGKGTVSAQALACNQLFQCSSVPLEQTVKLGGGKG
jgi:hypothetical protein